MATDKTDNVVATKAWLIDDSAASSYYFELTTDVVDAAAGENQSSLIICE